MSLNLDREETATAESAREPAAASHRFRECPPNNRIRRQAFCERARELLPNLEDAIQCKATALFGLVCESESTKRQALAELLERRAKFYAWFAEGKPAEVIISNGMVPDGEIGLQFARCWQAAIKATPHLKPVFALRADGFRVPLPHGFYRFNRSVLLNPTNDDNADLNVAGDPQLLRRGGLYCLVPTANGPRLESLESVMPRWKIALRMLRRYRSSVRPEILRRLRSGVRFEFSRSRNAVKIMLRAGRMPDTVRTTYRTRCLAIRARLDRVRAAFAALEAEGRRAAEVFAGNADVMAAQHAAAREAAITTFREARDRLWRIARECYRRDSLPPWPYRIPDEIRGWAKRGISPRQRIRLDHAIEWFTRAHQEVSGFDWNPLDDPYLSEHARHTATAQRILAFELPA